jgi:Short-chain dehydrogenases of various substrate specificities
MSFEIKNKNTLITGATSGIGKSAALKLAEMGANIFFVARNKDKAENLIREIKVLTGKKAHYFIADLSSLKNIENVAAEFKLMDIPLHVLLNNAGLINKKRKETIDGFEEVFAINHLAYFY